MQTCPHCDHQFPKSEGTVDPSAPDVIGCPECGRTAPLSDSSLETVALDDADVQDFFGEPAMDPFDAPPPPPSDAEEEEIPMATLSDQGPFSQLDLGDPDDHIFGDPIGLEPPQMPADPGAATPDVSVPEPGPSEDEFANSELSDPDFDMATVELGSLSDNDLDIIGTYKRARGNLVYSEDVVWKNAMEKEAASARRQSEQAPPLFESNDNDETMAMDASMLSDAFSSRGEDRSSSSDSPFGSSSSRSSQGSRSSSSVDEPIFEPGSDPFASLNDLGDAPSFTESTASDPLPEQPAPESGEAASFDDLDFSSLMGGDNSSVGDLFDATFGPLDEEGEATESGGGGDPFSTLEESDTFFVEAPSLGESPEESDIGGFDLSSEPFGDDSFDLDLPAGRETGGGAPPEASQQGPPPEKKRKRRKKKKTRSGPLVGGATKVFALAVLLLSLVGYGLDVFTDYGPFGMSYFFPPKESATKDFNAVTAAMAENAKKTLHGDTPADYSEEIARLEATLKSAPKDRQIKHKLLSAYLEMSLRFPDEFRTNPNYTQRLEQLNGEVGVNQQPRLKALQLLKSKNYDQAKAALNQALAKESTDPDVLFLYGQIAMEKEDFEEALEWFNKALALNPSLLKALVTAGTIHERASRYAEAEQAYLDVLQKNPSHNAARLGLARVRMAQNDFDGAEELARDLLAAGIKDHNGQDMYRAHKMLARVYAEKNDIKKRFEHLNSALQFRPDDEEVALEIVDHLVRQDRDEEAKKMLLGCLEKGCSSPNFYTRLVRFFWQRDPKKAEEYADIAVKTHPKDPSVLFLRGEMSENQGMVKNARSIYEDIIRREPTFGDAYIRLADLHITDGKYEEAIESLRKGLKELPNATHLLGHLSKVYEQANQPVKAKGVFETLLEKEPSNLEARLGYAKLLNLIGYAEEAVEQFEVLQSQGLTNSEVTIGYASALASAKRTRDAVRELDKLLRDSPQLVEANTRMGLLQIELQSYRTSELYLNAALRAQPNYAPTHFAMGKLRTAQEDLPAAIDSFEKAVSLNPANLNYRYQLASVLMSTEKRDDRRRAREHLDQIIDVYDNLSEDDSSTRNASIYMRRGEIDFAENRYLDALKNFEEAMLIDTSRLDVLTSYAETLYKMNRVRESQNYFNEVLQKDKENATAHYYLGNIALHKGDKRKAERHLLASVSEDTNAFPDVHKTLGYMYRAKGMRAPAKREFQLYLDSGRASEDDRQEVKRILGRMR